MRNEWEKQTMLRLFVLIRPFKLHLNFTLSLCIPSSIFQSQMQMVARFKAHLNSVNFAIIRRKNHEEYKQQWTGKKSTSMTMCTRFNVCVFLSSFDGFQTTTTKKNLQKISKQATYYKLVYGTFHLRPSPTYMWNQKKIASSNYVQTFTRKAQLADMCVCMRAPCIYSNIWHYYD